MVRLDGQKLKALRTARGIPIEIFAARLEEHLPGAFANESLVRFEHGMRQPNLAEIGAMAAVLGCKIDDLVTSD